VYYFSETTLSDIDLTASWENNYASLTLGDFGSFITSPAADDCHYIYIEGTDSNFPTLLTDHIDQLQNWVAGGGKLFLNFANVAASPTGAPLDVGFGGITITPFAGSSPFQYDYEFFPYSSPPGGSSSFSGIISTDPRLTRLMWNDQGPVVSYMYYGKGAVFFGGDGMSLENAEFRHYVHWYILRMSFPS
jgi:hypothetical protein